MNTENLRSGIGQWLEETNWKWVGQSKREMNLVLFGIEEKIGTFQR